MKTVEQVLEGVTAGGRWEVGGPYPNITLIYMETPGYGGESPEPPVYEPIATFFEANASAIPDSQAQLDAAYAARACSTWPELVLALEGLTKFSRELCEDTGISANYPSIQAARAALDAALKDLA